MFNKQDLARTNCWSFDHKYVMEQPIYKKNIVISILIKLCRKNEKCYKLPKPFLNIYDINQFQIVTIENFSQNRNLSVVVQNLLIWLSK